MISHLKDFVNVHRSTHAISCKIKNNYPDYLHLIPGRKSLVASDIKPKDADIKTFNNHNTKTITLSETLRQNLQLDGPNYLLNTGQFKYKYSKRKLVLFAT